MDAVVAGIDIAEDRLDVHVRPGGEAFVTSRGAGGVAAPVGRIGPPNAGAAAVEATGGLEAVVAAGLAAAGLPVVVVDPAQVRAFVTALGKRAETDPTDAAVVARLLEAAAPAVRPLPDAETRPLADLVARRRRIVAMIGAERRREERAPARVKKGILRLVRALGRGLASLDRDLDDAVRGPPPPGARRRTCSPRSRASARPSPAPCRPGCRSPGRSTGAGPRPRSASPPRPGSPAGGGARASSAADGRPCGRPRSWAPRSPPGTTPP